MCKRHQSGAGFGKPMWFSLSNRNHPPPFIYMCVRVLGTHTSECIDCANLDNFQRLLWQSVVSEGVIIRLTSFVCHPKYACDFCIVYQYQYCYLDLVI